MYVASKLALFSYFLYMQSIPTSFKIFNFYYSSLLIFYSYIASASVLFLGFQYFELQNIYKRIPNHIRIPIFSSEFVHR